MSAYIVLIIISNLVKWIFFIDIKNKSRVIIKERSLSIFFTKYIYLNSAFQLLISKLLSK